jgi:hypothetical protein
MYIVIDLRQENNKNTHTDEINIILSVASAPPLMDLLGRSAFRGCIEVVGFPPQDGG